MLVYFTVLQAHDHNFTKGGGERGLEPKVKIFVYESCLIDGLPHILVQLKRCASGGLGTKARRIRGFSDKK